MVLKPGTGSFWHCVQVSSPVGKWNLHLHKVGQQQEAWSALKLPGIRPVLTLDLRKHSGPTPADDMAPQPSLTVDFTLDLKQRGFCASPLFLQTLGPWFPKEMQNWTFIREHNFGPLSSSPVLFVFSPGETLLTLSVVQEWLDTRNATAENPCLAIRLCVVVLEALTPAAVHSLWISPTFLNGFCFTILSRVRLSLLLVHLFSTTSFPSLRPLY